MANVKDLIVQSTATIVGDVNVGGKLNANTATTETNGLMAKEDKTKLNNLSTTVDNLNREMPTEIQKVDNTHIALAHDGVKLTGQTDLPIASINGESILQDKDIQLVKKLAPIKYAAVYGHEGATSNTKLFPLRIIAAPFSIVYRDTNGKSKIETPSDSDDVKTIANVEYVKNAIAINKSPIVKTTYANLKQLRDNSQLIPGMQYRITDYTCTTTQSETQSAGHIFDIIVTADTEDILNEVARACLHEGDTYFANSKLESWELKYSLDNDSTRFAWADTVNGKGVIYYMKDEHNNECPYDFKNIQYKRYIRQLYSYADSGFEKAGFDMYTKYKIGCQINVEYSATDIPDNIKEQHLQNLYTQLYTIFSSYNEQTFLSTDWAAEYPFDFQFTSATEKKTYYKMATAEFTYTSTVSNTSKTARITVKFIGNATNDFIWAYTFSHMGGQDYDEFASSTNKILFDATIKTNDFPCLNVIKENISGIQYLNNNVFITMYPNSTHSNYFNSGTNHNSFGDSCYGNIFNNNCQHNSFGNSCYYNIFGNDCNANNFGGDCYHNTFGNYFLANSIGHYFQNNNFGNSCLENSFDNDCNTNNFGSNCNYNNFGNSCYANNFGEYCYYNNFSNECTQNSFGNTCDSNNFNQYCNYNNFGNKCQNNNFGGSCSNNFFNNGCYNNLFNNDCIGNTFGTGNRGNNFGANCKYNNFGNDCSYIKFDSNCSYNRFDNNCYSIIFNNGCQWNKLSLANNIIFAYSSIHNTVEPGVSHVELNSSITEGNIQYIHILSGVAGVNGANKVITVDRNATGQINITTAGRKTIEV